MKDQIWRVLVQILSNHIDSADFIKPFFENLHNENINDDKNFPLLKTFSNYQLEVLFQNKIITENKFNSLIGNTVDPNKLSQSSDVNNDKNIENIISRDDIEQFQKLILEKDLKLLNVIEQSFREVKKMKIPLLQYCIMKKAIKCFKYLLANGYSDPNKVIEDHEITGFWDIATQQIKKVKRYEWDSMATAIYFGNKEIMKILEEKEIEKGKNPTHLEAAILSYRNIMAEQIIEAISVNNRNISQSLNLAFLASCSNNNIKGMELLISKGANIYTLDLFYQEITTLFFISINKNLSRFLKMKNRAPLHYAAKNNSKEIGEILLSKGSYIDIQDIFYNIIIILFLIMTKEKKLWILN